MHAVQAFAEPQRTSSQLPHILVFEDDLDLQSLIRFNLEGKGLAKVTSLHSGEHALRFIEELKPSLVILDIMLPAKFGTEILREIRNSRTCSKIPVIMLTAKSREEDRVHGLELGADDYVTKPFSPKELSLRVQGLLRRGLQAHDSIPCRKIEIGEVTLIPDEHIVLVDDEQVSFTSTEFRFLQYLAERAGRLVSRDLLLKDVWEYMGEPNTRTVDTHVKRVRQKLGAAARLIETVHGVGYRMIQR